MAANYEGVRITSPATVTIDGGAVIGKGTVIEPGTVIRGGVVIGENCRIGPHAVLEDCVIGGGCTVNSSHIRQSELEDGVRVGPFANIREGCRIGKGSLVGTAVELKNADIGAGTNIPHLSYLGDAEVGGHVNIGCGCVTANFDGVSKYKTRIEDNAFLGCNSVLIAPVSVGGGAVVGAGSVVTDDVPANALAITRARQVNKENWAENRERNW